MKRLSVTSCALLVLGACLLTACSKNEAQTNNSSASSSQSSVSASSSVENMTKESEASSMSSSTKNTSRSSSAEIEQSMSIPALVSGDYKSVKGVWQDAAGNQLIFDENGLVSDVYTSPGVSATDYATAAGGVYGGDSGGFLIEFIPRGVTIADRDNFKDNSDVNRDRIWTGVGLNSFEEQGQFYYRVSQ